MAIFLLFWYGPSSPAQPICDRETSNRCTPAQARASTSGRWATTTPSTRSTASSSRASSSAATLTIASNDYECAAPCLGVCFRTKQPVKEELVSRIPATFSVAIGGAFLYLLFGIPIGVAAARRRGTVADKALVSSFLFISSIPYYLFALLTWLYLTVIFEVPFFSDTGYFPITEDDPVKWFSGHVPGLGRPRHLRLHAVHAIHPRRDGRGAQRGLHPHGQGQGPAARGPSSTSTACAPRWCRS